MDTLDTVWVATQSYWTTKYEDTVWQILGVYREKEDAVRVARDAKHASVREVALSLWRPSTS